MQPYQKANEEIQRQGELPSNLAVKGASLAAAAGGTAAFGKGLAEKALALTSKYVPTALAIKGLTKLSPGLGKFIEKAVSQGKTEREALDFVASKAEEGMASEQPAQEKRNIIEQESPELHQFIEQQVAGGRNPIQAGALAQNDKRFANVIKKLSESHKTPWSSIIESVYGKGERPGALKQQQQAPTQQSDKWDAFREEFKQFMNS